MQLVKFKYAGLWAENDTSLPQFEVAADEEREVSDGLAAVIVAANKGEIISAESAPALVAVVAVVAAESILSAIDANLDVADKTSRKNPAVKDKHKAELT